MTIKEVRDKLKHWRFVRKFVNPRSAKHDDAVRNVKRFRKTLKRLLQKQDNS